MKIIDVTLLQSADNIQHSTTDDIFRLLRQSLL